METVTAEAMSQGIADDLMSKSLDFWLKSEKIMNDVVKHIVSNPVFIRTVEGLVKEHVESDIDE